MDIQRLRNLTTHKLHTKMVHIYQDIETLVGIPGVMTHQIPNAMRALDPWLRSKLADDRFFNGEYDPSHVGEYEIAPMTESEREAFSDAFLARPSLLR